MNFKNINNEYVFSLFTIAKYYDDLVMTCNLLKFDTKIKKYITLLPKGLLVVWAFIPILKLVEVGAPKPKPPAIVKSLTFR